MCTCIRWKYEDRVFFARTLDNTCNFAERVIFIPRNFDLLFSTYGHLLAHSALLGIGTVVDGCPMFAEAYSEQGLAVAALSFEGNANYFSYRPDRINIAPYEFITFVLTHFRSVAEAKKGLSQVNILDRPFKPELPLTPLHWMIADSNQSLVVESTAEGLKIYDNPYDILTNNPPFPFHRENLNNYLNLTADFPLNTFSPELRLDPSSAGLGAHLLPGDYSSPSRFVKGCFLIKNPPEEVDPYSHLFHILDAVSPIKGTVRSGNSRFQYTLYSSGIDLSNKVFYFKTYNNNQIQAVDLLKHDLDGQSFVQYPIPASQNIKYLN